MLERKVWTSEQDSILKFLIEERGPRGWSHIAKAMEEQFQVFGRSGKQCRQRYHNHLDRNINSSQWTSEEQELLFALQDGLGNKWTLIASQLPGRTDNCIKNHFYSKLRKSLRNINKKINKFMKKEYRQVKINTLYRIIETLENRNRNPPLENDSFALCRKIKNHLYQYQQNIQLDNSQQLQLARTIIEDLALFDKEVKRTNKRCSLQSSAKLSQGSKAKGQSTRSLYDQESECSNSNNSSLFSSSSFGRGSLSNSQRLPDALVFKSQDIQFESQGECDRPHEQILYKSATILIKTKHRMPPIKQESSKRQSSKHSHSSHSERSGGEGFSSLCKEQASDMFGQESMEMRAISPQQLTTRQKIEIREQSNDALFYGQMQIEQQDIASNFSKLDISSIPVLGKYNI